MGSAICLPDLDGAIEIFQHCRAGLTVIAVTDAAEDRSADALAPHFSTLAAGGQIVVSHGVKTSASAAIRHPDLDAGTSATMHW